MCNACLLLRLTWFELQNHKTYLRTCTLSEDSDQTAHSRSLIWIFIERILNSQGCKVSSCGQWRLRSDCADAQNITKTCLYNVDPLKPHFYIAKLGFTGVYIIFLISAQNIGWGYSLEPPRRGGSNEYPRSMFLAEIWKISYFFIWKFSLFWWQNVQYTWIGVFS